MTAPPTDGRFRVTYRLTCPPDENPTDKALALVHEQTVELPSSCLPAHVAKEIVGRVERVEPVDELRWLATVSYTNATVGTGLLQFVNLLFGNISMQRGILLVDLEIPPEILRQVGGPRFGIHGLRTLCGVDQRPLVCTAAKPLGLTAVELARVCGAFALGGIDVVKDDHGLANQPAAPFLERVQRCQDAVEEANAKTGGRTLYFPNLSRGGSALAEDLEGARSAGCRGVLLSPLVMGFETVTDVAARADMAVLGHPALAGAFFHADHGITPDVLLGLLFRLLGCDGVIYPNVGGRFALTQTDCDAINHRLRTPGLGMRPAFPVPAGGIDVARMPHWVERYGRDTMFLIGGSLYRQNDLTAAAQRLVAALS